MADHKNSCPRACIELPTNSEQLFKLYLNFPVLRIITVNFEEATKIICTKSNKTI